MAETATAKIFAHGRSQAVRLPKEFRLPGTEVTVRRVGRGILLEPKGFDVDAWFAEMDRMNSDDFWDGWKLDQPSMPPIKEIEE